MAKTVYLHIGANKTGSSAIQSALNRNREYLLNAGLLYPLTGCLGDAHYEISSALGFVHRPKETAGVDSRKILELSARFREEVLLSSANDIIVSSESFVLPESFETVREFFGGYQVKIIVYVRRHDKWWPSAYNQAVRMVENPPWGFGFYSYMKYQERIGPCSSRGAYRLLLERWASVFGKGNIIVRPYEEQQNKPNIITDFLNAIGYGELAKGISLTDRRVNDSLDAKSIAFVEMFQRANISQEIRCKLISYVTEQKQSKDDVLAVNPGVLLNLVKQNQEDYEYIAREYLGRADGRLFYEPLPEASLEWTKPKKPTPAEIVELITRVLGRSQGMRADESPKYRFGT